MFLAKRTRPDILMPLSYLSTKVSSPTAYDEIKLNRIIKYINYTKHLCLNLQPTSLNIYAYIDASYALHPDAKGHSGIYISLGQQGGTIHFRSSKQKLTARSSTESELIAIHDGLPDVLWLSYLLNDLGYKSDVNVQRRPPTIFQDNKSTIFMANNGNIGKTGKSKHINVRYFFIKEQIDRNIVQVTYLPTEDMVSDILTKPLTGKLFSKFRKHLLNL